MAQEWLGRGGGIREEAAGGSPIKTSLAILCVHLQYQCSANRISPKRMHILREEMSPQVGMAPGEWGTLLFPDTDLLGLGRGLESNCLERGA